MIIVITSSYSYELILSYPNLPPPLQRLLLCSNIAERLRRRRSSVDLAMNIYPGDLLVQEHHKKLIKRNTIADFYAAGRQPNGTPLPPGVGPGTPPDTGGGGAGTDGGKKGRQTFSLLKLVRTLRMGWKNRGQTLLTSYIDKHLCVCGGQSDSFFFFFFFFWGGGGGGGDGER